MNICENSENQLKVWIATHIARHIDEKKLSQTRASELMGLKQPDLSAVLNGKFHGFSAERLARCLSALGGDVRLTVKDPAGSQHVFILQVK